MLFSTVETFVFTSLIEVGIKHIQDLPSRGLTIRQFRSVGLEDLHNIDKLPNQLITMLETAHKKGAKIKASTFEKYRSNLDIKLTDDPFKWVLAYIGKEIMYSRVYSHVINVGYKHRKLIYGSDISQEKFLDDFNATIFHLGLPFPGTTNLSENHGLYIPNSGPSLKSWKQFNARTRKKHQKIQKLFSKVPSKDLERYPVSETIGCIKYVLDTLGIRQIYWLMDEMSNRYNKFNSEIAQYQARDHKAA